MDQLSVKRQAVCTNFGYLKGEDLKRQRKDADCVGAGRMSEDPPSTILGYDILGSLSTALSYQEGFFYAAGRQSRRRALKKSDHKAGHPESDGEIVGTDSGDADAVEHGTPDVPPPAGEAVCESLEEEEQELFPFAPEHGKTLLEQILVTADESTYYAIASLFHKIPEDILARCVAFGSKLYVMENGKRWPLFSTLSQEQLELPGAYVPSLKASYIHKEALGIPTMQNLPLILFAHMYDHALGGDNFSSLKSPAVYSLYLACKQRKAGHQFLSGYSEAGSVQYFAQSMASYFCPDINNKLFTAEMFRMIDPGMYEYMCCLFGAL